MSSIEHGRPLIGPSSQNSSMNIAKKSAKCKIPSRRKKKSFLPVLWKPNPHSSNCTHPRNHHETNCLQIGQGESSFGFIPSFIDKSKQANQQCQRCAEISVQYAWPASRADCLIDQQLNNLFQTNHRFKTSQATYMHFWTLLYLATDVLKLTSFEAKALLVAVPRRS